MRLLLDECIDEELRHHFVGHDCQTCRYAGLNGLANGALLLSVAKFEKPLADARGCESAFRVYGH